MPGPPHKIRALTMTSERRLSVVFSVAMPHQCSKLYQLVLDGGHRPRQVQSRQRYVLFLGCCLEDVFVQIFVWAVHVADIDASAAQRVRLPGFVAFLQSNMLQSSASLMYLSICRPFHHPSQKSVESNLPPSLI